MKNKSLANELTNIEGISSSRSKHVLAKHGIGNIYSKQTIEPGIYYPIIEYTNRMQNVGAQVNTTQFETINKYIQLKTVKGFRHKKGYPVRGQRTRSNAQTQKKLYRLRRIG